jgi:hypothetical protein
LSLNQGREKYTCTLHKWNDVVVRWRLFKLCGLQYLQGLGLSVLLVGWAKVPAYVNSEKK